VSNDAKGTQAHPKAPKGTQEHPTSDNNIICKSSDIPNPTPTIKRGKEIDLVSITSNMKYKLNSKVVLDNYNCEYCSSLLKSKRILVKHLLKSCKYIPVDFKNHLISIHNKNGNTKNKLELIPIDNIVSNNIVNNNNIQNNITINNNLDTRGLQEILPMLQEDMSHITRSDVLEIFSNPENFMLTLLSKVYSNPRNRNVYLNKRDNTITYLDAIQKRLTTKDKDKCLKKLYNNFMGYMDDYLDDVKGELSSKVNRIMRNILELHDSDDIELLKDIKKDISIKIDEITDICKSTLNNIEIKEENGRAKYYYKGKLIESKESRLTF
jgi:hypothetical protein